MSNLSDKEIDRLSREAADSYEPDTSSLSWTRLEQKLKEQMPERPPDGFQFGRINPYLWGPAVVLLAGASFFFIKNNTYSKHSTRTNQQNTETIASDSAVEKTAGGNTIFLDSNVSSADIHGDKRSDEASAKLPNSSAGLLAGDKKTLSKLPAGGHHAGPDVVRGSDLSESSVPRFDQTRNASNPGGTYKNTGKNGSVANTLTPASAVIAGAAASGETSADDNNLAAADNLKEKTAFILPGTVSSGAGMGKISENDSLLNRIAQSGIPVPHKSLRINRSLNFGFAFGPDYTDAGGITNDQLGNNIGFTVGYYLTNKLSINTGIFYSNKFYWSPGHGIPNQGASWGGNTGNIRTNAAPPAIEYVNGACNMYELPFTLRYDFAQNDKTKFFVNGGLSSYFMLKQTYINFFHSAGMPVAYKTVDEEQLNYWFDVAALSFGLESEIGKGFSFQAEPFFRIPLKDMGSQNLRLNTYGFMLSFRYTPVLSRSRK
jgi:hypothetical protein